MDTSKVLLSGGLFYTPPDWATSAHAEDSPFRKAFVVSRECLLETKWHLIRFTSETALIDAKVEVPPFVYLVYYLQASRKALVLGYGKHIVDAFVKLLATSNNIGVLEAVYIDVQGLVALVCSKPGPYAVTYLHARTSGLGSSLRSLSFYGDDVTGASLYRKHAESLLVHTCGLRDVYADKRTSSEAIRVSAQGKVSFYYGRRDELETAVKALNFIYKAGFLLEPQAIGPRVPMSDEQEIEQEET